MNHSTAYQQASSFASLLARAGAADAEHTVELEQIFHRELATFAERYSPNLGVIVSGFSNAACDVLDVIVINYRETHPGQPIPFDILSAALVLFITNLLKQHVEDQWQTRN